jgi:chemotaxis protein MotB
MAKAAWEDLVDADLGPYGKPRGTRWGRVFTGLLLVASATFVAAYYLPLYQAHQRLGAQFRELGQRSQTLADSVSKAQAELKSTTQQRDDLQAEHDKRDVSQKADADKAERVRATLASKLDKFVKKGSLAVVADAGSLLVALDSALLFQPQKLELTPGAHTLLCDLIKSGEAKTVTVRSSVGDVPASPVLAKSYPTPWALSAARAAAVAQSLEADCALSPASISAEGDGKHDPAAAKLTAAKLPADHIELELGLH